ncbi:hypothetical protein [Halolamina sp.]|jgi:hypothetical protein|uniref:hypothetical protein n=1 Tax=Halolamina sp. TaxID=1940283 RepID=UPI00356478C0
MSEHVELRNATVYDGSGSAPVARNVLVADGRIEQVSPSPVGADRVLDLKRSALDRGSSTCTLTRSSACSSSPRSWGR